LLHLAAQGLLAPPRRDISPADVVAAVRQMVMLQIDTIHVVARSPYLVLHSRLGEYPAEWLDQALVEGQLAECWAHEACMVVASDISLFRAAMRLRNHHWAQRHAARMHREQREGMDGLLERIRLNGPVRAADFVRQADTASRSGWWEWKPEKRWLEAWFALGELMVSRRERFQRVYDLSDRVLAALDPAIEENTSTFAAEHVRQQCILLSVRALGVTQARWVADYCRLRPAVTDAELQPLLRSGELLQVAVQGWSAPGYVHAYQQAWLEQARGGRLRATRTTLLSPFDPLVWDRDRAREMFDFDYALECYTPAAKRRYGYFVLPILHRGRIVGRLDAKAHRRDGVFEVKALFLEPGVAVTASLVKALAAALRVTARWHETPQVSVQRGRPKALVSALRAHLNA
jgi:hypothetical protein